MYADTKAVTTKIKKRSFIQQMSVIFFEFLHELLKANDMGYINYTLTNIICYIQFLYFPLRPKVKLSVTLVQSSMER